MQLFAIMYNREGKDLKNKNQWRRYIIRKVRKICRSYLMNYGLRLSMKWQIWWMVMRDQPMSEDFGADLRAMTRLMMCSKTI